MLAVKLHAVREWTAKAVVFLAVVISLLAHPGCSIAQSSGLVAAYSFNEGSGTTVSDLSGNNLTGTIVGATWTTAGRYGNALSFNGTSSYVDLGNPTALQLTGSMTLEAWVNAAANPANDGQIIAKSSGVGWQLKTTPDTGPYTFGVKVSGSSSASTQRYSSAVRSLNTWYHVAGVYNASTGTLDIYVNGILNNGTLSGTIPAAQFNQNVNVNIGRRTGGYYFNGIIDEVRIYNRALSQAEIQTDMNTPIGGTPPPPDTIPPTVSITSPADGATVAGTVGVTASASDNVGVAGVQFLLDNANLGSEVTSSPFTLQWNTTTASIGTHALATIARDFSNNTTRSTSVSVTVSNPVPSQFGQWSAVMNWPMVAVHAMLLPSGNVLGWTDYTINGGAQIWRPANNTFTDKTYAAVSLFCAGHAYMADGRLLITGGIVGLQDDMGPHNATIFDPVTENWSQGSMMASGRYYPTATTLSDGRILVQGGTTTCKTCIADLPEIYDPVGDTWTPLAPSARMAFKYYPHTFLLPDGRVIATGQDDKANITQVLDLNTQAWTTVDSRILDGHSSVMYLPGKIIKAGTATADNQGLPAAATTYVLDMTQPSPAWQTTAPMAFPRSYLNLTVLPDGEVVATGGGTTTDKANFSTAVYEAELWSPATKTWTTMARMKTPRLYHSTALLLPDATVLVAGGGRENGRSQPDPADEPNAEIFSPPYLFKGSRPVISSAPSVIRYGAFFSVATPDAARIASVSLIALGAVTHAFNENQRFVPLSFGQASGSLQVIAPIDGNTAPPGPYMLFLVDTSGVPSVAAMVRVTTAISSPPNIANLSVVSGVVGSLVTITGTNFSTSQGTSTVTFNGASAGVASAWSTTNITVHVPGNATSGNVVATVDGVASNGINFTVVPPTAGAVLLVQHADKDAGTTTASTIAFPSNNTAGNWIGVVVRAAATGQVITVTDTRGNTYRKAVQLNETVDGTTLAIYYAEIIAGGPNTIGVSDTKLGTLRFAIFEYLGVALSNSLDGAAVAQGTSASPSTVSLTTTASGDLLLGAISTANGASFTAGSGYTIKETVPAGSGTKLMVEDQIQGASGATLANATLGATDIWGAAAAAFGPANGSGGGTPTPTSPSNLTGTSVSSTQINLSWTAATETGGAISNYLIERCSGPACNAFAQVVSSKGTSVNDTGLTASTSYSYRVRAVDAANSLSVYSNIASATTSALGSTNPPVFTSETHSATDGVGLVFNNASLSLNVSGTNTLLIASWHSEWDGGPNPVPTPPSPESWSVTCNGVPGTVITQTNGYQGGDGNRRFRIYYWLNPTPGTNTIVVSNPNTGPNELAVSAILLNNVSQTGPFGTTALDVSTTARTGESETISTSTGDLVLHVIADALFTRGILGPGETSISVANDGGHTSPGDGDASLWLSTKPGDPSNTTVSSSGWASRVINGVAIVIHGAQ